MFRIVTFPISTIHLSAKKIGLETSNDKTKIMELTKNGEDSNKLEGLIYEIVSYS